MSLRRPKFQEETPAESINISPLIDVIFILLIFFIVTMVFADGSALKVEVPKANSAQSVESRPLTVVIKADSTMLVDGKIVSIHALETRIREHIKKNSAVILRGDKDASVSALVSAMDCAKMCGVKEIYVSADKK